MHYAPEIKYKVATSLVLQAGSYSITPIARHEWAALVEAARENGQLEGWLEDFICPYICRMARCAIGSIAPSSEKRYLVHGDVILLCKVLAIDLPNEYFYVVFSDPQAARAS